MTRDKQVTNFPKILFHFGRDRLSGPNAYAVGFYWYRNLDARPGELVYRRHFLIRWYWYLWIDKYGY